ncbi:Sec20-domain-containing protein [Rhodocollybia butyracea]|uniref:Sec20-domain-containing protein n=1 Tax=Rhodocollybia butyracea TaxID=206335 RepID=A0A9P5QBE3_9AGAR|nr:Sec20-domain-containing protein [Rhodocollybia butyracea]
MPPLPPAFDSETTQLVASVRRRQIDLTEVQIPRLQKCSGPLSLQQKLSAELREDMDTLARQIESLDVMVDDQKGQRNRTELRSVIEELKDNLARLRKDYRTAMLTSKRTIDSSSLSNRNELLASVEKNRDVRDVNEKATEDAVMKANNDVTEALQRTLGLMQGELERSVLATQMLDSSIVTLRATSSTHDMLSSAMDTSKQLITALQKADWIDRLIIFFGLGVFFLVTIFILKQRIVDRSVRLAFWWTRFLPSGKPPSIPASFSSVASSTLETATITSSIAATATTSLVSIVSPSASLFAVETDESSAVPDSSTILVSVVTSDTPVGSPVDAFGVTEFALTESTSAPLESVVLDVHNEL